MALTTSTESTISNVSQELNSVDVQLKILDILHDAYPNLDCGPGTPVYEMAVRPIAMLWQRQIEGVNELLEAITLTDVENMPDTDLDNLLGRYFITRRVGRYVTGVIRIYFRDAVTVSISAGDFVTTNKGQTYQVISDHFRIAEELTVDSEGNVYMDVAVRSVGTGSLYNADAGTIVTVSCASAEYIQKAYFVLDSSDGGQTETNAAFLERAKEELASKNLYAFKSVRALFYDTFSNVKEVIPIGIRDDEMIRDVYAVEGDTPIHLGGKCDIYIKPFYFSTSSKYEPPLGFPLGYKGYTLADNPSGLMTAWNSSGYKVTTENRGLRGSSQEKIDGLETGISDELTCLTYDLSAYNSFIESDERCSLHTDNLVKLVYPIVVTVALTVDTNAPTTLSSIKTVIATYINNLASTEYPKVADIIHIVKATTGASVRMTDNENSMFMRAYYLNEYAEIEYIQVGKQQRSSEYSLFIPLEPDSLRFIIDDVSQISLRTCCWYTNEDLIKVEGVNK